MGAASHCVRHTTTTCHPTTTIDYLPAACNDLRVELRYVLPKPQFDHPTHPHCVEAPCKNTFHHVMQHDHMKLPQQKGVLVAGSHD